MSKATRLEDLRLQRKAESESVHIGLVHGDQWDAFFGGSLFDLARVDMATHQRIKSRTFLASGPRIASSRNNIVRSFLKSDCNWLLCLDTDIVFPPDALDALFAAAEATEGKFISGLYYLGGKDARITPAMYLATEDNQMNPVVQWPKGNVVAVDAVGAGCMLIHRDVFEAIAEKWEPVTAYPWFAETEHGLKEYGEDITFCLRVRQLGIPIYVHTGLPLHHRKTHLLNEVEFDMQEQRDAESQAAYERQHLVAIGAAA